MDWHEPLSVGLADLPRLWRSLDVTIRAPLPPSFDTDWSIGGRVRGALGHVLRDSRLESARARARRERLGLPTPFELFFAARYLAPPRASTLARAPTRPVLLAVRTDRRRLVVTARLFGVAMLYQRQIEAALVRTLEAGIAVAEGARSRARLPPDQLVCEAPRLEGEWPDSAGRSLRFCSPLALLRKDMLRNDPRDVFGSLLSRNAALALWQGLTIAANPGPLAAELASWNCRWENCRVVGWERRSIVQPGRVIPMVGVLGRIEIEGGIDLWQPLLRLAPVTHIGSHTTFGMGAVDLA